MNLDKIANIPCIVRKRWHINDEPKHYLPGDYYKTYDLVWNDTRKDFDRVYYWEESDESLRNRLTQINNT
jgi:hypothetical protein